MKAPSSIEKMSSTVLSFYFYFWKMLTNVSVAGCSRSEKTGTYPLCETNSDLPDPGVQHPPPPSQTNREQNQKLPPFKIKIQIISNHTRTQTQAHKHTNTLNQKPKEKPKWNQVSI